MNITTQNINSMLLLGSLSSSKGVYYIKFVPLKSTKTIRNLNRLAIL